MPNIITLSRPQNFQPETAALFSYAGYSEPQNKVHIIHNAALLFNGMVLKNGILLRDSYYQYPAARAGFIKKAYQQFFASTFTRSRKFVKHEGEPLISVNQPWFNFYHWLLESLPRLYLAKEYFNQARLVLPASYMQQAFVRDTLALIPELREPLLNKDENLLVQKLYLPALRPYCHAYNISLLQQFRTWLLERIKPEPANTALKLFLVRNKAQYRRIINQQQIADILHAHGFKVVDLEDYTFTGQVNLFRNVTHVVAQHGAGLSHILFMSPGARIMELHKEITNSNDHVSHVYWSLASAMKVNYYYLFCKPVNPHTDFFKSDITVDVDTFERELKDFLE